MSSEPVVQLFLDTFLVGLLPKDGDRVTNEFTLAGTDGTSIVIKANSNTIYKEKPRKVFEAVPDKSVLFLFEFPVGTLTNPDSTKFTTIDNSVYTFSTGDGVSKSNDKYVKVVTEGTIQIKPPEKASVADQAADSASTFINPAVIQESSLGGMDELFGDVKDNPFYNMLLIIYDVMLKMIVVFIFWLLFISISCWLTVPSDYLYPADTSKFPYRYFTPGQDSFKDYLTHTEDEMCEDFKVETVKSMKSTQDTWFKSIKDFETNNLDKAEILKIIYPEILSHQDKDVNKVSTLLYKLCSKQPFGIMECVTYTMNIVLFHSYISCTSVLSTIHTGCSVFSNRILGSIINVKIPVVNIPIISVLFAVFLYFLLLNTTSYNDQVIELLKIKFSESTDIQSVMINQFMRLIVCVITACMLLFVPLFIVLFIVSAGVTFYILCKQLFDTFNGFILFISIVSLYFAMINYATLALVVSGIMPLNTLMEGSGGAFAIISAISSIFSIGIPLLTSFGYAGYISGTVILSSFKFMSLQQISEMIKRCITSLVIISLFIFVVSVQQRLGPTYMTITIMIILLMGIIIASGNG